MAKKKKRKDSKKTDKNNYQVELKGLLLILIAIIGFGRFGIVGRLISAFFIFLAGTWYNILLSAILIIGGYMMVKREKPNFFTSKLVGLYVLFIGILVFSHLDYIIQNDLKDFEIVKETINNFMASTKTIMNVQGGGVIGAICSILFVKLFDVEGTKIVVWALLICGTVMFTGFSIADCIQYFMNKAKDAKHKTKDHKDKVEIRQAEDNYDKDDKVVVSSVDELIHKNDDAKATLKVDEKTGEIIEEPVNTAGYKYPPISLLTKPVKNKSKENQAAIDDNVKILGQVFSDFGINGKIVAINIGPTVTQYEMELKAGTKVSKVLGLQREIALALAVKSVHIQAPIPGKSTIGIELPNKVSSTVTVREILEAVPKNMESSKLLAVLGKDIMGIPKYCEINKTPHLLVAGSTGSGKSVCINSMITSILMRAKPDEVKLVLVDPKKVELSMYNPNEVQKRKLPYIVVIIDELADLMLVAAKEVEDSIMRITQMARAAGIHLIVATQRPSTDVITGVVKANIPSRISFAVSSSIDSRTILDMTGAEKLLGKGDMLFLPQGENTPIRIQGTFISEEEIKAVVDYTISQQKAKYDESLLLDDDEKGATTMVENKDDYEEPLYNDIVEFVVTQGKASASLLQRRFHLGYNRAARCIDLLEERGIVGPSQGSKPREVLVKLDKKEEE